MINLFLIALLLGTFVNIYSEVKIISFDKKIFTSLDAKLIRNYVSINSLEIDGIEFLPYFNQSLLIQGVYEYLDTNLDLSNNFSYVINFVFSKPQIGVIYHTKVQLDFTLSRFDWSRYKESKYFQIVEGELKS